MKRQELETMKIIPERYLDESQMSKAMCVTKRTLHSMRKRGDIPYIRIANRIFYDPISVRKSLGISE